MPPPPLTDHEDKDHDDHHYDGDDDDHHYDGDDDDHHYDDDDKDHDDDDNGEKGFKAFSVQLVDRVQPPGWHKLLPAASNW